MVETTNPDVGGAPHSNNDQPSLEQTPSVEKPEGDPSISSSAEAPSPTKKKSQNTPILETRDSVMVHQQRTLLKTLSDQQRSSQQNTSVASSTYSLPESVQANDNRNSVVKTQNDSENKLIDEESKENGGAAGNNEWYGGMHRHDKERIDRLGKLIKSKREKQPNGQKKRLPHKVTFCDQLQSEDVRQPLEKVIFVESYKRYNLDTTHNDNGCCAIF